jgi:hypothetical protein
MTNNLHLEKVAELISRVSREHSASNENAPELVKAIESILNVLEKEHGSNPGIMTALKDARKAVGSTR